MQTDDGMFLHMRHIPASVSVSVSIHCRTNTGSNAAGGRERRSHANSRTECSIPGTLQSTEHSLYRLPDDSSQ